MNCAVPSPGDNQLISILYSFFSQLDGMGWVNRSGPVSTAVLLHDRSQVSRLPPGLAHIGVGIDDKKGFLVIHKNILSIVYSRQIDVTIRPAYINIFDLAIFRLQFLNRYNNLTLFSFPY